MKTARLLAVFAAISVASSSFGQITLSAWDFTGESNQATSVADTLAPHLDTTGTFNTLTRGSAAGASSGANSFRTTGFKNEGISISNADYFQFVVSASDGYELSLNSISANFAGTSTFGASPGVSMQFAYSTDGSTFSLIGSPFTVIGASGSSGSISLSAISVLQNVASNTSITMRFFASGQTITGGWGFFSSASGVNGLTLSGTTAAVSAVPEPSTYAAIFGAVALVGAALHRRRQRANTTTV